MNKIDDPTACPSCKGGDPWVGIVCDDCSMEAVMRRDLQDAMAKFVFHKNRIMGQVPGSLIERVRVTTRNITRMLEEIKIDIKAYRK